MSMFCLTNKIKISTELNTITMTCFKRDDSLSWQLLDLWKIKISRDKSELIVEHSGNEGIT